MWQKNNGFNEADKLQNRFTAYLAMAIQRRRKEYIMQIMRQQQQESLTDNPVLNSEYDIELDIIEELPLLMRLENDMLMQALKELSERERYVFLGRVLDEKSFEELAVGLQLSYKGVAAIYYRVLRKIRKLMQEVDNDF